MTFTKTFETPGDLLQFIGERDLPENEGRLMRAGLGWLGLDPETTLPAAREQVGVGWVTGLQRLRDAIAAVPASPARDVRRRGAWADQGDELNRDRLFAGQVETCWRTARRQSTQSIRNVRVVVDSIAFARTSADTMFWRGAAACRLVDSLTEAGYSVEVLSAFIGEDSTDEVGTCEVGTIVKGFEDPLDASVLAACVASPAFFRLWGHMLLARLRAEGISGSGYRVRDIPADGGPFKSEAPNVATVLAPRTIDSAAAAQRWLAETVAGLEGTEVPPTPPPAAAPRETPRETPREIPEALPVHEQRGQGVPAGAGQVGRRVMFQGLEWRVDFAGPTKYGPKAKLVGIRGAATWLPLERLAELVDV